MTEVRALTLVSYCFIWLCMPRPNRRGAFDQNSSRPCSKDRGITRSSACTTHTASMGPRLLGRGFASVKTESSEAEVPVPHAPGRSERSQEATARGEAVQRQGMAGAGSDPHHDGRHGFYHIGSCRPVGIPKYVRARATTRQPARCEKQVHPSWKGWASADLKPWRRCDTNAEPSRTDASAST